jgi:hypothetical protein
MGLMNSYTALMTFGRPSIRPSDRLHLCVCGLLQMTKTLEMIKTLETEISGPE